MSAVTPTPSINQDSTITALIARTARQVSTTFLLPIRLPVNIGASTLAGRYFLVRCGAQSELERAENWQFYLRKPLFVAGYRAGQEVAEWEVIVPTAAEPAYQWLLERTPGETINLLGPLGVGFQIGSQVQRLLLCAQHERVINLLPLIEQALNRGIKVVLLIYDTGEIITQLRPYLPLAVEIRCANTADEWNKHLAETVRWADQVCAAIPQAAWVGLAELVRRTRMRIDEGFAQLLVESDLACGVGACLACIVPVANGGFTRACVHGPAMDLKLLVR